VGVGGACPWKMAPDYGGPNNWGRPASRRAPGEVNRPRDRRPPRRERTIVEVGGTGGTARSGSGLPGALAATSRMEAARAAPRNGLEVSSNVCKQGWPDCWPGTMESGRRCRRLGMGAQSSSPADSCRLLSPNARQPGRCLPEFTETGPGSVRLEVGHDQLSAGWAWAARLHERGGLVGEIGHLAIRVATTRISPARFRRGGPAVGWGGCPGGSPAGRGVEGNAVKGGTSALCWGNPGT